MTFRKAVVAFNVLLLTTGCAAAQQSLTDALIGSIANDGAIKAEELLQLIPKRFSELDGASKRVFESPRACLSELQLFVNTAVVVSQLMPFSNVWTNEVDGSVSATFRLMVDGERIHARISCQNQEMISELLDWVAPTPQVDPYRPGMLAASLGVLLSMKQRGVFDDKVDRSARGSDYPDYLLPPIGVPDDSENQASEDAFIRDGSPSGSSVPLTVGEKDALQMAVQQCLNVGSLGAEALNTTVVVAVEISEDGKPVTSSIKKLSHSGGNAIAARQAFEAARRAIIRCGARGFALPKDKYDRWQHVELTFDFERMQVR